MNDIDGAEPYISELAWDLNHAEYNRNPLSGASVGPRFQVSILNFQPSQPLEEKIEDPFRILSVDDPTTNGLSFPSTLPHWTYMKWYFAYYPQSSITGTKSKAVISVFNNSPARIVLEASKTSLILPRVEWGSIVGPVICKPMGHGGK